MIDWAAYKLDNAPVSDETESAPYRPSQWSGLPADESQLVMIKSNISDDEIAYFFDAFIREEHTHNVAITEHPVQDGANLSDHAYNLPSRVTLEILMSDAMDSIVVGQFSDGPTKSISAYNKLMDMKEARKPLQVTTRLQIYDNMLIENIHVLDDFKTNRGLRATVTLKQIFTAKVQAVKVSIRPNATNSNNKGAVQPQQPTQQQASVLSGIIE